MKRLILFLLFVFILVLCLIYILQTRKNPTRKSKILPENYKKCDILPKIPHVIHQTWKSRLLPDNYKEWSDQCKRLHPDWKFRLWTDEDNRAFIQEFYPQFLRIYDSYDKNIKRVDAVRYFYLYHYGGVYMDLDFTCLKNLDKIMATNKAVFGYQLKNKNRTGAVANAFMAAPPKHPLFKKLINNLENKKDKPVLQATGPAFLTTILKKYMKKHAGQVKIYEMPLIYTHEWNDKNACKNIADCRQKFPQAYTATFWTGSWL